MSNLIGENLSLQLCTSVIEKIGIIHGSEYLQNFYTKCLKKMENKLSVNQKEELNKIVPYISNSLFLPPILTKMIENNLTFMEAIKLSKSEISETCARLTGTLKKIETNEVLSTLIYSVFEKVCSIQDHAKDPKYVINASLTITNEIYDIIQKSNLLFITLLFSTEKNIRTIMDERLINPLKNKYFSKLRDSKNKLEINEVDMFLINIAMDSEIEKLYVIYPLQSILSKIIIKAINENLTFTDAISNTDFTELKNSVYEDFKDLEAISQDEIDCIIDSFNDSFDNL